jgi:uncharacterized protein (DUF2236 family)
MTAGAFPEPGLFSRTAAAFAASVPESPADDGFFGPSSVAWRLHGDLSSPVAGLRSLLLQALHPLAMAGVTQHSRWREDPGSRLASTAAYVITTTYGDRAAARAAAARVRKIHEWVTGTDPVTGKPYAANDPALLLWVHAGEVDSYLAAAQLYGTRLSAAEADQYVAEMTATAELIGMPAASFAADSAAGSGDSGAPASVAELAAYFDAVRPSLIASHDASDTAAYLLAAPGIEEDLADIWRVVGAAAVASLPGWAREMYGFGAADAGSANPGPGSAPASPAGADREEVRQVLGVFDALYLGEPGVLEARQRITLRMRAAERQAQSGLPQSGQTQAPQTRARQTQAQQTRARQTGQQ